MQHSLGTVEISPAQQNAICVPLVVGKRKSRGVLGNVCAETKVTEIKAETISDGKTRVRESIFIEKDEARKLPLNKQDATPICPVVGAQAIIQRRRRKPRILS